MKSHIRPALICFVWLTILTGVLYPAVVTVIAQTVFPRQANGSLIVRDGQAIGSSLIAQPFTDPRYFWPRPSSCEYDGAAGSGSNLGPTNPIRARNIEQRTALQRSANVGNEVIPDDLLMASASGLDPHITPEAARYQLRRVAASRNLPEEVVQKIVDRMTESPTFHLLGERRVNVLRLNLALDHPEILDATSSYPAPISTQRWQGFLP